MSPSVPNQWTKGWFHFCGRVALMRARPPLEERVGGRISPPLLRAERLMTPDGWCIRPGGGCGHERLHRHDGPAPPFPERPDRRAGDRNNSPFARRRELDCEPKRVSAPSEQPCSLPSILCGGRLNRTQALAPLSGSGLILHIAFSAIVRTPGEQISPSRSKGHLPKIMRSGIVRPGRGKIGPILHLLEDAVIARPFQAPLSPPVASRP